MSNRQAPRTRADVTVALLASVYQSNIHTASLMLKAAETARMPVYQIKSIFEPICAPVAWSAADERVYLIKTARTIEHPRLGPRELKRDATRLMRQVLRLALKCDLGSSYFEWLKSEVDAWHAPLMKVVFLRDELSFLQRHEAKRTARTAQCGLRN